MLISIANVWNDRIREVSYSVKVVHFSVNFIKYY